MWKTIRRWLILITGGVLFAGFNLGLCYYGFWFEEDDPINFHCLLILPVLYLWCVACRKERHLKTFLCCTVLSGIAYFLSLCYIYSIPHIESQDFRAIGYLLLVFYLLAIFLWYSIAASAMPFFLKILLSTFLVCILATPFVFYCSFDYDAVCSVWVSCKFDMGDSERFWGNGEIQNALHRVLRRYVFLFVCFACIFGTFPRFQVPPSLKKHAYAITCYFFGYTLVFFYIMQPTRFVFPEYPDQVSHLAERMKDRANPLDTDRYRITDDSKDGMYFLIVGESHNYETSMKLSKRFDTFFGKKQNDPNFVLFRDVHTWNRLPSSGFTCESEYSVCHMITDATEPVNCTYLYKNANLIDVSKKCGSKTLWLSNFGDGLAFARIELMLAGLADFSMINEENAFDGKYAYKGFQIDSEIPGLLKSFYDENILDRRRSFMFVQPMGPHTGRYVFPSGFKEKYPALDDYEVGIVYFEQVLEQIFDVLTSFPETKAIVYCSDHSLQREYSHKLAMLVYLSDDLQKERPKLMETVRELANEEYVNRRIYDLFLEIMGVSVQSLKTDRSDND